MAPWQLVMLLGIVILVWGFSRPKQRAASAQKESIKEIEETLEQFAYDIEEDNKELMKLISDMKNDHEKQWNKLSGRMELLEKQTVELFQSIGANHAEQQRENHAEIEESSVKRNAPITYERPTASRKAASQSSAEKHVQAISNKAKLASVPAHSGQAEEEDREVASSPAHLIKDRYKQVFDLYHEGKSIEFIAKKIGLNKGEVQLIVQLAKQEEQFRV